MLEFAQYNQSIGWDPLGKLGNSLDVSTPCLVLAGGACSKMGVCRTISLRLQRLCWRRRLEETVNASAFEILQVQAALCAKFTRPSQASGGGIPADCRQPEKTCQLAAVQPVLELNDKLMLLTYPLAA